MERRKTPTQWIEDLDRDFWRRGLPLAGAPRGTPLTALAAALDRGATAASLLYAFTAIPSVRRQGVERYAERLGFYTDEKLLAHPERFFPPPPERVSVSERAMDPRRRDPEEAERVLIEFYSPFETVNPGYRERYQRYSPNERVECRGWFHRRGPRPVVICIHGFAAPDYTINTELFFARALFERGLDVVLFNLPFHGARRPPGAWFHGQHFIGLALWRLNEACSQAVTDLRVLLRHLRARGAPAVGVTGYSLGGYHTALLAGVEADLDFAIPMAPVVTIADLMFTWPIGMALRLLLRDEPDAIRELRRLLALHTPLTHALKIPKERTFLICGIADRMAPPSHTQALWEHWGRPRLLWTRAGHLLIAERRRTFRAVVAFLRESGVIPATASPRRRGRGPRGRRRGSRRA